MSLLTTVLNDALVATEQVVTGPTVVSPVIGPAGGGGLINITGDLVLRQYAPLPSGDLATPSSYVRVTFGTSVAEKVFVYSTSSMDVLLPPYMGDPNLAAFPAVDVTIENLDDDGDPISGQTVTLPDAFTYSRESLRPPTLALESPVTRISRKLLQLLKRQILLNCSQRTHTDFSSDGIVTVKAGLPSVYIMSPDLVPDAYGWENEEIPEVQPDGSLLLWPNPIMHTLVYDIMGHSDSDPEFLTLMSAVRKFFWRNPYLVMAGDVPAGTQVRLPLVMTTEPSTATGMDNANLRTFRGTFEVRRVPILYLPPYYRTWTVSSYGLETQKVNGTLVEVKTLW